MRWWGLAAVATGFHSPARQTCEADFRSAPTRCWPVKGQSHREGFRFQPRAFDNCRLKSLQFFSFLAFYPEPVTTALRQRTVTPTWQRYAVVAGAAGPRREPGSDNPNPRPERISKNPIPSPERVPAQEDGPVLVLPGRSLGLGRTSRYFGGRNNLKTKRNTSGTPGATGGPIAVDQRAPAAAAASLKAGEAHSAPGLTRLTN